MAMPTCRRLALACLLLLVEQCAGLVVPGSHCSCRRWGAAGAPPRRCSVLRATELDEDDEERRNKLLLRRKVYGLAEIEAPLRTSRLLFLYPVALVFAVVTALNSNIVIARSILTGSGSVSEPATRLLISVGIAGAAAWSQQQDQRAEAESLREITARSPQLEKERAAARTQAAKPTFPDGARAAADRAASTARPARGSRRSQHERSPGEWQVVEGAGQRHGDQGEAELGGAGGSVDGAAASELNERASPVRGADQLARDLEELLPSGEARPGRRKQRAKKRGRQ